MSMHGARNIVLAVLVLFGLAPAVSAQAEPAIAWKVENPFRLFKDPKDTALHRATYEALTPEQRRSPILNAERALERRHPAGWAATMVRKVCWDGRHNRYACEEAGRFVRPREHEIVATLQNVADAVQVRCTWLTAPLGQNAKRGLAVTRPCNQPVRLKIPYPSGAMVSVEIGGLEVARTKAEVEDLFVVGMGDSFGSGEGNPDVPVRFSRDRTVSYGRFGADVDLLGYPARVGSWEAIGDQGFIDNNAIWLDQACHRSLYSHQLRVALQLAIEQPHRAVTFLGLACSGAEITKGLFLRYKGNEWVPNPPDLSQISAAAVAQCGGRGTEEHQYPEAFHMRGQVPDLKGAVVLRKCPSDKARKIDLLLVSVGGNDVGFSRLVANAVLNDKSLLKRLGGWFGEVYRKADAVAPMAELISRYKALTRAAHNILHIPWDESDRIVLVGYPRMALIDDGRRVCPSSTIGMDVLPAYGLSSARARDGEEVGEELNDLMRRAAREFGWRFVDHHRDAFVGHGICAGFHQAAFSIADDLRFPRKLNGHWKPYNPADYHAYTPRQRWFRTPNDAFLTGNFHVAGSLLRRVLLSQTQLLWTQLMLASTYSGAFHPTAEGQAAIADAVAAQARAVIEHYDGGNLVK